MERKLNNPPTDLVVVVGIIAFISVNYLSHSLAETTTLWGGLKPTGWLHFVLGGCGALGSIGGLYAPLRPS